MKVVRRTCRASISIGAAALLLSSCGGSGSDGTAQADEIGPWAAREAISAQGNAYQLELTTQPLPTVGPADEEGYVRFGLGPASLRLTNKVIDQATPGFLVDTYLFFDCDLLGSGPVAHTDSGELIISSVGWEAEPERLVAVDGGHCVLRFDPVSVDDGLGPGGSVMVEVGQEDLGFVAPEDRQGRIETMLGRPLYVQFGVTEASGASFYTDRAALTAGRSGAPSLAEDAPVLDAELVEPDEEIVELDDDALVDVLGEETYRDLLAAMSEGSDGEPFDIAIDDDPTDGDRATTECPTPASAPRRIFDGPPPMCIDPAATYRATVATSVGEFTIELDAASAPLTVNNFVVLSRYGFFDDTPCHRIITDFVTQCGDPTGTGLGGPGYTVADELPQPGQYERGSVAMANSGPDTNGSQWFVVTGDEGVALPPQYSLFGTVSDGLDDAVVWMNGLGTDSGVPRGEVRIESVTITIS